MINLTSEIYILDALNLSRQVHIAIGVVNAALAERYGDEPVKINWHGSFGFQFLFGPRNIFPSMEFDSTFISSAYKFTKMNSRHEFLPEFLKLMAKCGSELFPPSYACGSIKRGLKMLLVQLHAQRAIILPSLFETGTHFKPASDESELLKFIKKFEVDDKGGNWCRRL